jgi:hypothetical protein
MTLSASGIRWFLMLRRMLVMRCRPRRQSLVNSGEDHSRGRERNAARNLAVLRRIALDLLRADTSLRANLKGKRKTAAWEDVYMARLLRG